jgi:hypothetical protein
LIEELKFISLERRLEIIFQLQFGLFRFQNSCIEQLAVGATERSRPVESGFGVTQYVIGAQIARGADGDANAHRQTNLAAAQGKWGEDLQEKAISHDLGVVDIFQAIEQDGEVIALQSDDEIVVAQAWCRIPEAERRLQASGDSRQEGIPRNRFRPGDWPAKVKDQHSKVEAGVPIRPVNGATQPIQEQ